MLKSSLIALLLIFGATVNADINLLNHRFARSSYNVENPHEHHHSQEPAPEVFEAPESPNNQYVVSQLVHFNNKDGSGIQGTVTYTGTDEFYKVQTSPIVQTLNLTVTYDSDNEFTILLDDATSPRFKLPHEAPYSYTKPGTLNTPVYSVKINENPFSISVIRTATGEVIFNTASMDFIYSDYYLSFGTTLPSKYLYGLGERRRDFLYQSGLYTIWNKDQYAQIDYGQGNQQTYGTHPMYLMREQSGLWHVVYLRNSNGMDFKYDSGSQTLQYLLTGSVIELKFFFGFELPDVVLKLYHNYINGWSLMPFWSHGYHQSKYGVIYLQDLLDIVGNFTQYKIPIDVIWSDIDYMYSFTDFTVDEQRYDVAQFRQLAESIHWVPIVDAGVSLNSTSDAYNRGMAYGPWIKSAQNNTNPLVGVVWPGVVHWVDFLHPNASTYWKEMFTEFYNTVPYSGIWLDMNEYSNFCTGEFNNSCNFLADYLPDGVFPDGNEEIPNGDQNANLPPSPWAWLNSSEIPYSPGNVPLEQKSLPINGLHYGDELELNWHNVNGFLESKATYEVLQTINGKRPFILSRSTHVGSGQYVAHWSGDNYATWDFLRYSVSCIFNFQLYGIPMTGDDICGFGGNTTPELCARWMQLGAFYPFMRNHMAIDTTDHYPYSLGDTVLQASIASLKLRYSILKYYYSLFVKNQGVGTVFRPLFFDYPYDESLLSVDNQFLIGSELMVSPVIQEGQQEVSVYFPFGYPWYNFFTGELVQPFDAAAQTLTFDAPLNGTLPLFIKGSSVVPVQNTDNVTSTKDLNNVFNLVVAMYPSGVSHDFANGQILGISNYSDDASVDKCVDGNSCQVSVNVINTINTNGTSSLTVSFQGIYPNTAVEQVYIGNISLYGLRTVRCGEECHELDDGFGVVVCDAGNYQLAIPTMLEFVISGTSCQANQ